MTTLRRWDNPVPMSCDGLVGAARYVGRHIQACRNDAAFVELNGEDAVAFWCERHVELRREDG